MLDFTYRCSVGCNVELYLPLFSGVKSEVYLPLVNRV